MYGDQIPELLAQVDEDILVERARSFTVDGFRAWFRLMHKSPLHREGEKWAENIFLAVEGERGLLQEAWRGSGKTTVLSWLFFTFFVGHHPHTTSGIIRINDTKASETARAVADVIDRDDRWKKVFPHVVPDKERGWGDKNGFYVKRTDMSESQWKELQSETTRPQGPTWIGYGWASGSVIGSRWNGIALVDDIHDRENTRSQRQLNEVKEWVREVYLPIPVPRQTIELWNFTPWLGNDVYAERKETGQYILSRSPVMRKAEEGDEDAEFWPHDERIPFSGQWYVLSWPERWHFEQLTDVYINIGSVAFARMYMLDLEATSGLDLKREWLSFYPHEDIDETWPVIFGVDYASTADKLKNKDRDYFALAILRAIPGGGLVIEGGVRRHVSKGEALQLISALAGVYPTLQRIAVENIGVGSEFYNDLVFVNDALGRSLPLMPITHGRKSKGERFQDWLAPRFQVTRIWVSDKPVGFIDIFMDEWLMWPRGEHDDTLDAVYMAARGFENFMPSSAERTFDRRPDTKSREAFEALTRA